VIYLPTLWWSLGLDQNIFAEIGSLILKGQRPYIDAWDVKPPNVYYTYAFFQWILGATEFAVRSSDFVFTLLAAAAMFLGVDRRVQKQVIPAWLRRWSAVVAAILLTLTLLSLGLSDTAQTESFSLVFLLAAAYLAIGRSSTKSLLAGLLIAVATFYKTTNAVFLLPLIIEALFVGAMEGARLRAVTMLLFGWLAGCLLELGALSAVGSLDTYLRIASSVFQHHSQEPGTVTAGGILRSIWVTVDLWSVLALAGIALMIQRRDRTMLKVVRLPLMYLVAGIIAVYVQQKGWGYHYVITQPGLISVCALASTYLVDTLRTRYRPLAAGLIAVVILASLSVTPSARRRTHYVADVLRSKSDYRTTLGAKRSLYYPVGTDSLANYLERTTKASDPVFIFGEEPGAYWKADRQPASPYVYSLLFTSGVIPDKDLRSIGNDLRVRSPSVIIVERYDTTAFRSRPETSESILATDPNFANLRSLIANSYAISDTVCDKFIVYRRRS
jgi:hypothetical protein